ncbi:unnamed protein product [Medioppia subpectinata]|uniref:NR LBD domain-containing protein n=1 Tax=Medioppia subpectinata TaxID=1979941 RepID=A0A7R9KEJ6_9ACAR|nr:unnamed protein product [Medioppia subpectinata]CAG2102086.1 unnamed protein product [Medioppia subpectinata]
MSYTTFELMMAIILVPLLAIPVEYSLGEIQTGIKYQSVVLMAILIEFVINHDPNDSETTDISDSISDTTSSLSNDTFAEIIGDKQSNEVTIYMNTNSNSIYNYKSEYNEKNAIELKTAFEVNNICFKFMDRDVEDLISLTKSLKSFNNLCFNDQLALIKYGFLEIVLLRYSILYDFNTDYWTWLYKSVDKIESLTTILLFNPNRPNLVHRDVVNDPGENSSPSIKLRDVAKNANESMS